MAYDARSCVVFMPDYLSVRIGKILLLDYISCQKIKSEEKQFQ